MVDPCSHAAGTMSCATERPPSAENALREPSPRHGRHTERHDVQYIAATVTPPQGATRLRSSDAMTLDGLIQPVVRMTE